MNRQTKKLASGYTIIEVMITIAIFAILAAIAVPNLQGSAERKRLIGAAEQVYSHMQQARLESISRFMPISANFSADGTDSWEYGISHNTSCDLTTVTPTDTDACVIVTDDGDGNVDPGDGSVDTQDLVLMHFDDADHQGITMTTANFTNGSEIIFTPMRGTSDAGEITLASGQGDQLRIQVSILGRVRICSPNDTVPGYSSAGC